MIIKQVVAEGEIRTLFQPIVALDDGSVVAHEALSRGPAGSDAECPRWMFAAAAEGGCEYALDVACRSSALRRSTQAGWTAGAAGPLFLNVRPGALAEPSFLTDLEHALGAVGRSSADVVLEISEAERIGGDPCSAASSGELPRSRILDRAG